MYYAEATSAADAYGNLTPNQKKVLAAAASDTSHHPWCDALGGGEGDGDGAKDISELSTQEVGALLEMLEAQSQQLSQAAAQECEKSIGSLPSHMKSFFEQILADMRREAVVPWTRAFADAVASHASLKERRTMRRAHTRLYRTHLQDEEGELFELPQYEMIYPGKRIDRDFAVLYAIDTSGSMSDREIAEGLVELTHMRDTRPGCHVVAVQCDAVISDITYLKEMSAQEYINEVGRTSGGGTHFADPFKLARAVRTKDLDGDAAPALRASVREDAEELLRKFKRIDLIVYVTDGYGSAAPRTLVDDVPVIWALTQGRRPNFPDDVYGTFINITR